MPNAVHLYKPGWMEPNIDRLYEKICTDLMYAPEVDTGHWQAKKGVPQTETRELVNAILQMPINGSPGGWASYMKPNLPWAEDHFLERVGGQPLNPPPSHVDWPFNQQGNKDHMDGKAFSHSYPERLWPRLAPQGINRPEPNHGIRYEYGDLSNAVDLLLQEPYTRQCFIPIWFPEDLRAAAVHNQRVPCTLGYHMMRRDNQLHCFYPMRSLDLLRYFRDDAYMAGRLVQWLIKQCRHSTGENSSWHDVAPGVLTIHAVSLHIFQADIQLIQAKRKRERQHV